MSDIFREVDEDIRRDQLKKLWDRFGPYVLGLALLIVLGTAGYRGWEYWQERQAQASGDRFISAIESATTGKHDDAIATLEELAKTGSGGYPVLAEFRIAGEKAAAGDKTGAVAAFDAIVSSNTSSDIKNLARLRAALLLVDTASVADLQTRIGDLAATGNTWRGTAREILGLAAYRAGDYAGARKYYTDINADQGASDDAHQRASLMLALITAKIGAPPAEASTAPADAAPAAAGGKQEPATP